MKKINLLMAVTFLLAIASAFAFKPNARPLNANAEYKISGVCSGSGTTDQANCNTTNTSGACTVNVSGHPLAFNPGSTCMTQLFSQP
jgi:hypothetical protein